MRRSDDGGRMTRWWWLSFADGKRPAGSQFLGAAVVPAPDFQSAVLRAHALRFNPGGEVRGAELPAVTPDEFVTFATYADRLLTITEIGAFDRAVGGDGVILRWPASDGERCEMCGDDVCGDHS